MIGGGICRGARGNVSKIDTGGMMLRLAVGDDMLFHGKEEPARAGPAGFEPFIPIRPPLFRDLTFAFR